MHPNRTRHSRSRSHSKTLQVRVMSPRIAWFSFLNFSGKLAKFTLLLALLGGGGWACWLGFQEAFYKNPEFRLQALKLNENPILDEAALAALVGINPPPNLFEIDTSRLKSQLDALPGVISATVDRELPNTLAVTIVPRIPRAWILSPDGPPTAARQAGGLLVDQERIAYPCPEKQLESAKLLPTILLPNSEKLPIRPGLKLQHSELTHCLALLDAALKLDPQATHGIDTLRQVNPWSLLLTTHQGTEATFGLGDHHRQLTNFRTALNHSTTRGYTLKTINLLPERNVPITLATETPPPRAIPVAEPSEQEIRQSRRVKDLNTLLQ